MPTATAENAMHCCCWKKLLQVYRKFFFCTGVLNNGLWRLWLSAFVRLKVGLHRRSSFFFLLVWNCIGYSAIIQIVQCTQVISQMGTIRLMSKFWSGNKWPVCIIHLRRGVPISSATGLLLSFQLKPASNMTPRSFAVCCRFFHI